MNAAGFFELQVRKADGSIRKQFAEFKWAHKLRLKGFALPNLLGITGYMTDTVGVKNLVTNAGFAQIVLRMGGTSSAVADYIGVGTGTTAANAADTTLETEISDSGLTRAQGTISQVTTTVTGDTHQVAKTFTVSGTKAVTECGLLNASSSGTLVGRNVFSAVNVVSGDTLAVTYKVKVA